MSQIVTTQPSLRAAALVLPWHRPPGQVWRRSNLRVVERGLLRARTRTPSQHLHRHASAGVTVAKQLPQIKIILYGFPPRVNYYITFFRFYFAIAIKNIAQDIIPRHGSNGLFLTAAKTINEYSPSSMRVTWLALPRPHPLSLH